MANAHLATTTSNPSGATAYATPALTAGTGLDGRLPGLAA